MVRWNLVSKALLCLLVLTCSVNAQQIIESKVDVQQTSAIFAASADVQPLEDKVAVFLVDRDPGTKSGLIIKVTSNARFIGVRAYKMQPFGFVSVNRLQNGSYVLFGDPGSYWISVTFSDPELGLDYKDLQATIPGETQPEEPVDPEDPVEPDDPVQPDGPLIDEIAGIALRIAKELNDPTTAKRLSEAYTTAVGKISDTMSLQEAEVIVQQHRRTALLFRLGDSRKVMWDKFINGVDPPLKQLMAMGVKQYRDGIKTLAIALENSVQ